MYNRVLKVYFLYPLPFWLVTAFPAISINHCSATNDGAVNCSVEKEGAHAWDSNSLLKHCQTNQHSMGLYVVEDIL